MLKRIISIAISATGILLGGALLWPEQADRIFERVTGITPPVVEIATDKIKHSGESFIDTVSGSSLSEFLATNRTQNKTLAIEDIVDETNKARIKEGLAPLRINEKLITSAKSKTDDMIALHYFEHESPSGKSVSDLGEEAGYDYIIMGENLALGDFKNAKDLVDAWMNSPGHRANILNTSYQDIGIYAARGMFDGQEVWFAVQHFGAQRSVCPIINTALKTEIETINRSLDKQQKEIEALKKELEASDVESRGYDDKINLFNAMVASYNKMLEESKSKIVSYNKQVATFNACLVKYQQ